MTMITPSYLGETIEYSSLHACRSTLEDPTDQLPSKGAMPYRFEDHPTLSVTSVHSLVAIARKGWSRSIGTPGRNQLEQVVAITRCAHTGIFYGEQTFTKTIEQMSDSRSGNTHEVIGELFRAMDTKIADRKGANIKPWANAFPYVNGGLFAETKEVPHFSRIARSYLLHAGRLDWKQINPDIFGSMIQAVADDDERGELGMHYTSVPNILKVLNPLFLDDLREQLQQAGDNPRKLLNLRRRIASIRVVDPACGSGNFLVIAYIQMREIEAEIIRRRHDEKKQSWIKLSNFHGIELKDFATEIARLALLIAEFQSDVRLIGQQDALIDVLPLKRTGQIYTGNALRLDWLKVCPPAIRVEHQPTDLFDTEPDQPEIDFKAQEVETYICGNPPYKGSSYQTQAQKDDLKYVFADNTDSWKNFDYIAGWFFKASMYARNNGDSAFAFVSTNSICQGQQVGMLWPLILRNNMMIRFAHTSFKWANLATNNAGVTVIIVGVGPAKTGNRVLYQAEEGQALKARVVPNINPYLAAGPNVIVVPSTEAIGAQSEMLKGNQPTDGGHLCLTRAEAQELIFTEPESLRFIFRFYGSQEFIRGEERHCIWVEDEEAAEARAVVSLHRRFEKVDSVRRNSKAPSTRAFAHGSHRFIQIQSTARASSIIVARVSSERREFLPVGLVDHRVIVSDNAFALYDAPLWNMALIASRVHLVWIATVCGKMKTDFRYSNTLGWNTFPVSPLTEKNKADLTRCAEDILLAREAHFPATIAELYNPESMPDDLRRAHDRNDETLERIYIGRRFKNDTERLEKLFDLYTKMTAEKSAGKKKKVS